jgi:hypothetical protein
MNVVNPPRNFSTVNLCDLCRIFVGSGLPTTKCTHACTQRCSVLRLSRFFVNSFRRSLKRPRIFFGFFENGGTYRLIVGPDDLQTTGNGRHTRQPLTVSRIIARGGRLWGRNRRSARGSLTTTTEETVRARRIILRRRLFDVDERAFCRSLERPRVNFQKKRNAPRQAAGGEPRGRSWKGSRVRSWKPAAP